MNAPSGHKSRSRMLPGGRRSERNDHIGLSAVELDRTLDVRERLVHAIEELEAGEPGISCRVLLEGLLEDFDREVAAERSR